MHWVHLLSGRSGVRVTSPTLKCRNLKGLRHFALMQIEYIGLEIGYHTIKTSEYMLPNGKKLVQIDYVGS